MNRPRPPIDGCLVSVVLPVYNEAVILKRLFGAVVESLERHSCYFELVFVNDGSSDGSDAVLDQLAEQDPRVRVLHLSRNFGHQAAVQAGLVHAQGDAIVIMDSDMQDDPRCIAAFLDRWQEGFDVVYAIRTDRKEGPLKRALFFSFYRLLNLVSQTPVPNDAGNFGLIDRRVAQCICDLPEHDRFYPGLRSWIGFRQTGVEVERHERHDQKPRVSLLGLCSLAKTAVFSFSSVPLLLFYVIGAISLLVCGGFTLFTMYHKFATGLAIPGWTSMIVIASFFGALNSLGIAILGEYVVRIYDQVRARPTFIVARNVQAGPPMETDALEEELLAGVRQMAQISDDSVDGADPRSAAWPHRLRPPTSDSIL